jgi:hypothetical protein
LGLNTKISPPSYKGKVHVDRRGIKEKIKPGRTKTAKKKLFLVSDLGSLTLILLHGRGSATHV